MSETMSNNKDRINALLIPRLEIIERAQKHLYEVCADPKKFRMSVPVQDGDTDRIFQAVIDLARESAGSLTPSEREQELWRAVHLAKARVKAMRQQIGRKDAGWHQSMCREIFADLVRVSDSITIT